MISYPIQINIILSLIFYFLLIISDERLFLVVAVEIPPLKDTVHNDSITETKTGHFDENVSDMVYKKIVIFEGSLLKLKCDFKGSHWPNITWTINGKSALQHKERDPEIFHLPGSGIVLENVTVTDSGLYKCDDGGNEKGHIHFTYEVEVMEIKRQVRKPNINELSNISVHVNKNVNFECIVESDFEIFIEWYYHNSSVWKVDEDNLRQGTLLSIWNATLRRIPNIEQYNSTLENVEYNWSVFEKENLSSNIKHRIGTKRIFNPGKWQLIHVTYKDEGWYSCFAVNRFNSSLAGSYLRVVNDKMKYFLLVVSGISFVLVTSTIYILVNRSKRPVLKDSTANEMTECEAMVQWFKNVVIERENNPHDTKVLIVPKVKIERSRCKSTCTDCYLNMCEYKLPCDPVWEFPREKLLLGKFLGEGAFGKVVQGVAEGVLRENETTTVGVKMLNDEHTDNDMLDFVSELEIMKIIGKHKNIINLLGCCTQNGPLYLLVEYAQHGNLRDFLRQHRSLGTGLSIGSHLIQHLTEKVLVYFAFQISQGMEYLASRKCIHRDLAAKNVLVSNGFIMNISDFGLAKDIHHRNYYKKTSSGKVPVKWMAPESLFLNVYTTQSDVYLKMRECWTYEADGRPTFKELVEGLYEILSTMTDQEYVEVGMPPLNTPPSSQE